MQAEKEKQREIDIHTDRQTNRQRRRIVVVFYA